jgi:hypothetical protein
MLNIWWVPYSVPVGRLTLLRASACSTSSGVELDADGVLLGAEHLDLGDAADRRDSLGHVGLRVLVDRVER